MQMVQRNIARFAFLAALAFPLAACGSDGEEASTAAVEQEMASIPEDANPDELMAELQSINQELTVIQEQAMNKPELQERRAAVEEKLVAEMKEMDPEVEAKIERAETIEGEVLAAREGGESSEQEMQTLMMEWQELQSSLQETQERAVQREAVAEEMESFRDELLTEMNEVDPRAGPLMARAEAILARLQQQMPEMQQ